MLSFHKQGLKIADWAKLVAQKFQTTEDTIKKDWSRRRSWVHLFLKLDDPITMAKNLIADNEVLFLDAQNMFEQADDQRMQLQLMWLRLKISKERTNIFKEICAFSPIKVDFEEKARTHKQKIWDEKDPSRKGDKDHEIRQRALRKSSQDRAYFD